MGDINLQALGFTKEELQNRVIDRICAQVLRGTFHDEDGSPYEGTSQFGQQLNAFVQEQISAQIAAMAEAHIAPNVAEFVENLVLEETNQWGEKKGKKWTLVEYIVERATQYMQEPVDYSGKGKGKRDSYSWKSEGTRLAHMVNKHLHYTIENAVEEMLRSANKQLADGIEGTVKTQLAKLTKSIKVGVVKK